MVRVDPFEEVKAGVARRCWKLLLRHLVLPRLRRRVHARRLRWQRLLHRPLHVDGAGRVRHPVLLRIAVLAHAVLPAVVISVILRGKASLVGKGRGRGGLQVVLAEVPGARLEPRGAPLQGAHAARPLLAHPREHHDHVGAAREHADAEQGREDPGPPGRARAAALPHLPDVLRHARRGADGVVLGLVVQVAHVPTGPAAGLTGVHHAHASASGDVELLKHEPTAEPPRRTPVTRG
mmetsp:Transcript_30851/g.98411  ORF Transcript_30851/g.98411 Transcript_30851/m.98411 type:complete len:236 (+) Transcript_30851:629-1336(+)